MPFELFNVIRKVVENIFSNVILSLPKMTVCVFVVIKQLMVKRVEKKENKAAREGLLNLLCCRDMMVVHRTWELSAYDPNIM